MKCFVLHCNNSTDKLAGNAFSYHMFPKDEKIRTEWLIAIGRDGCEVTHHRVCSHHFAKNDFELNQKRRLLKIGAIPSRNLPSIKPDIFSEFLEEFNENFEEIPNAMGLSRKSPAFQEEQLNVLRTSSLKHKRFPKDEKIRSKWLMANVRNGSNVSQRVCSNPYAKNDYNLNQNKRTGERIQKTGAIPSRNLPNLKPEDNFSEFLEEFNDNFEDMPNAPGLSKKNLAYQEDELNVTSSLKNKRFPRHEKIRSKWLMANVQNGSNVSQRVCSNPYAKNDYDLNQRKRTGERIQKTGAIPSRNLPNLKPEDDFSEFLEEFNDNFEDIPNALGLSRKNISFQEEEPDVPRASSLKNKRFPKDEKIRSKRFMANDRNGGKTVCSNPYAKKYNLNRKKRTGDRLQRICEIPSRNLPNIKPEDEYSEFLKEFNQTFDDIPNALGLLRKIPVFQKEEINVPRKSSVKHKRNGLTTTPTDLQEEATSDNTCIKVLINSNETETETITIEVTSDKEEEDDSVSDNVEEEEETTIDQLTDPTPLAITINCKNQGCDFKCKDLNLIIEHSKTCRHTSAQKQKTKIKINESWYKCCLCNSIIKHRALDTHTKFHAREKGDLFLKVEFKKFFKGEFLGYKTNTAEPLYKHNITNAYNNAIINKPTKHWPELDYNPDEPVFECDECNFKTNETDALEKHRKLHWNAQKNEMFKTRKLF